MWHASGVAYNDSIANIIQTSDLGLVSTQSYLTSVDHKFKFQSHCCNYLDAGGKGSLSLKSSTSCGNRSQLHGLEII